MYSICIWITQCVSFLPFSCQKMDPLYSFLYSSIATIISRSVTFPLDSIKTLVQNGNIDDSLSRIIRRKVFSRQITTLFQGLGVTLLFSVPGSALYFTSYEESKLLLTNFGISNFFTIHSLSAIAAEGVGSVMFVPMEVMKQKLQVGSKTQTTIGLAKRTWCDYGIRGFYKGYFLTLAVFIPYTVTYFVSYEQFKNLYCKMSGTKQKSVNQSGLPFYVYSSASLLSASIAGAVSNPMEVIKTRIQISSTLKSKQVALELYRQGGLGAFATGMTARVAWAAPSMAITITAFELFKDFHNSYVLGNK